MKIEHTLKHTRTQLVNEDLYLSVWFQIATVDHTNERPPIDLFKAIFEDSDSENDSVDDNVDPAAPPTDSVGNISADFQKSSRDAVVTSHTEQSALRQIQESEITLPGAKGIIYRI